MSLFKILLFVQIGSFCLMALGILGQKFQILPFKMAFGGFILAMALSLIVFVIGLIFTLLSFGKVADTGRALGIVVTLCAFLPLVLVAVLAGKGFKKPRIHDISTNLENNIEFTKAFELRRDSENSLLLPEDRTVELQKQHYPDLKPMLVEMSPATAYENALLVADELGWQITQKDKAKTTFEAVDETKIFGFRDDVVVRVRPFNSGSRIDLRSVSRVGVSDLGANAARIERFQQQFKDSFQNF
ncbi:hypothetical protein TDB9533_04329 [Thalassocella blandensis]|nr:hypothetical protein TDB9533_04329 [Thalassocella blandensis]